MNHFCTITTQSHLYKVHALSDSLSEQNNDFLLHVLVVDSNFDFEYNRCVFTKLSDLKSDPVTQAILKKYKRNSDKLRWSLKPVFLVDLLSIPDIAEAIYLDNDLFFYSDYSFLFNLLQSHSFLLTPHYYKHDPTKNQNWLEANFRVGLFNAGFVGANKRAIKSLIWWAECCAYRCEKNTLRGTFDDQKYLDLIPVMEETAHILKHKGCNVAGWNKELCQRKLIDGEIKIDGINPIVFIHFNHMTIREIVNGNDNLLISFYQEYIKALKKHKPDLTDKGLVFQEPLLDKIKLHIWETITKAGF